jgi:hypothetical protein
MTYYRVWSVKPLTANTSSRKFRRIFWRQNDAEQWVAEQSARNNRIKFEIDTLE